MQHKLIFIFLLIPFLLFASTNDRALYIEKYASEKKVALVIGNSNYDNKSLSKLKNPINDARAVRDKLKEKNFEVLYLEDATQREIDKEVRKFSDKLKNSGVGLFYFAGHGLEVDKKNYLIPIGANVSDEVDVKYEALGVNEIVDRMKRSGTRLNLVVLDACRNNPFKRGAGGLAPMQNAKGTLIAYATDSGSTASDNPNEQNGLFTKHFLKALDEPLNQREFFHKVRKSVYEASNGKQLPYLNDGTIGDFFFTVTDIKYQSSVSLQDEKQQFYTLFINPTPYDATVQITNISPKYHDGIKLKKGSYDIKVSKDGYVSKSGTIELKSDLNINVELEKEKVVFKESSNLNGTIQDKYGNTYKTVKSPYTGKVWLDRNLGASRVCTSFDDSQCYGDYFQWGRDSDGHEKQNSSSFKAGSSDWTSSDNSGAKRSASWNPCPSGFRIPTIDELTAETLNQGVKNRDDAYRNFLKLPSAGNCYNVSGSLANQGSSGYIWSSSLSMSHSKYLYFHSSNADAHYYSRAYGLSVRCLREEYR